MTPTHTPAAVAVATSAARSAAALLANAATHPMDPEVEAIVERWAAVDPTLVRDTAQLLARLDLGRPDFAEDLPGDASESLMSLLDLVSGSELVVAAVTAAGVDPLMVDPVAAGLTDQADKS